MVEIGELVGDVYTDVETDSPEAPYAVINSYFELLPDQEDGKFDGDSTISRAQAMALVMRATTQVESRCIHKFTIRNKKKSNNTGK